MNQRKAYHLKIIGLVTILILILGTVSPTIGSFINEDFESEDEKIFDGIHEFDGEDEVWYIEDEVVLEGEEFPIDASIQINETGSLTLIESTLTMLIDGYNAWDITIIDGGELTLLNSTITTKVRDEYTLRPFLKTNISAYGGSTISLMDNSSFMFPGWVYLEESELIMKESRFEPLDEVPEFDYTWLNPSSVPAVGMSDNDNCPRLIANQGSHILMEDSEIIDNYLNQELNSMEWDYTELIGDYSEDDDDIILEPGDNIQIDVWNMLNPQFPTPGGEMEYPYLNPFDRISSLYIELEYRTEEEYEAEDPLEYESPEGLKEAFRLKNTEGALEVEATNIFELGLDDIGYDEDDFIKELTVMLENGMEIGSENATVTIESINLYSSFDNDMHLWDSTMTVINSVIDVDFNPSDIDPRPHGETVPTTDTTWMANADQRHRTIRVLYGSNLRTYGMEPTDLEPEPDGDPIVVTDEVSRVNIYRWIDLSARDKVGNILEGAEITVDKWRGGYNDPGHNEEALDYMERTYGTIFEDGTYITDDHGKTTMFLLSDNITHPDNWPNSRFLGHYTLEGVFEDEDKDVGENVTSKDITQKPFPNMYDNVKEVNLTFDMEIPSPDLYVADDDLLTLVNGDVTSYVTIDMNVTVELTVYNQGTFEAEEVLVEFYLEPWDEEPATNNELDQEEGLIGEITIDHIGANENETASIEWVPDEVGDFLIIAVVDPYDEIQEWNETNHMAQREISVGEKAQLRALDLIFEPASVVEEGTEVNISAGIDNVGGIDVQDVNVSFYYDSIDEDHRIGTRYIDVAGNGTEYVLTEPLDWDYPDVGTYNITVVVDPNEDIDEQDREQNVLEDQLSILTEADLQITHFELDPEDEIYQGDPLTIDVTIENEGEWESEETFITFYVDDDEIKQVYVPPLDGGESRDISEVWIAELEDEDASEETRTISVDLDGLVESEDITVMRPAHLSVSPDDISFSTDLSEVNEPLVISAVVYNHGGETVEATVRFYANDDQIGEDVREVEGEGDSKEASIEWTPDRRGNKEITVVVYLDDDVQDQAGVIKPIFSQGYEHDLIVNDDNTPVTRRGYGPNGFVVVEESGELTIGGLEDRRSFEMIHGEDNRFSVIVRDGGRLVLDNVMVYSDYEFSILVEDEGHLEIINDCIVYEEVSIFASDDAIVEMHDSSVRGPMEIISYEFGAYESEFLSTNILVNPSNMYGVNSTFEGALDDFSQTDAELLAVHSPSIIAHDDARIEILRWVKVETESHGGILLSGTHVSLTNDDTDYEVEGTTKDGVVHLPALTDIITAQEEEHVVNYEIYAEYREGDRVESFDDSLLLPRFPSTEYVVEITITFEDLLIPDLAVFDEDVTVEPEEVAVGEDVIIYADISNLGMADAEDANVGFYVETGQDEYVQIGTDVISVPSGETRTANIVWEASMTDEDLREEVRRIRVFIDPEMEPLSDPKLENNEAFTEVTIHARGVPEFVGDLMIHVDGSPIEDETVIERDELTLSVNIRNTGGSVLEDCNITMFYPDEEIGQNVTDLGIDETINITNTWEVDVRGELTITVWFNTTEGDLELSRTIMVEEMDIIFTDIIEPTGTMDPGDFVSIVGEIRRGHDDKRIQGMRVQAYLIDEDGNEYAEGSDTTDAQGEFFIDLVTPQREGNYRIRLVVDHPSEAEHETVETFMVGTVTEGIPLWMIAVIIIIVVALSLVVMIVYLKYKGEGEWVECGECGSTIPAESTTCPKCGTEFEMDTVKCSECGEWISADERDCPHCGAEFITTGKEVEDYSEAMKKQYESYVNRHKRLAKEELGDDFTEEEFMVWWQDEPSYLTFDEWLEQEEDRRKKGGIECPQCGALNSIDDALCQKCGSTLVQIPKTEPSPEEEEEDIDEIGDLDDDIDLLDLDEIEEMESGLDEPLDDEMDTDTIPEMEPSQKRVVKKVKKRPKKVKKKVVKKPKDEEE